MLSDDCDESRFTILSARSLESVAVVLCLMKGEAEPLAAFAENLPMRQSCRWTTWRAKRDSPGALLNLFFSQFARDLVVMVQGVEPTDEWLSAILETASANSDFATVSSFAVGIGALAVPNENSFGGSPPWGVSEKEYSDQVRQNSLELHPSIPRPGGGCWYISFAAWNIVGGFDASEQVVLKLVTDFGISARRRGFRNLLADSAFISDRRRHNERLRGENEELAASEYSSSGKIYDAMARDRFGAFCLSKDRARLVDDHVRVGVDCTSLSGFTNGTTLVAICSAIELKKHFPMTTAVIGKAAPAQTISALRQASIEVETVDDLRADDRLRFDVFYRPNQIHDVETLRWIKRISDRSIVNILDLIPFHMRDYHDTVEDFLGFRNLQRLVFETMDGFGFLSNFVLNDAVREYPRLASSPCHVVSLGVDADDFIRDAISVPPVQRRLGRRIAFTPESSDLLVSGVAYRHKNRVFALRLASRMWDLGWKGRLFMSGPFPTHGSSEADEREWLASVPFWRERVVVAKHVEEQTYREALSSAGMVLYPSVMEGFGLPPFEAGLLGAACVTGDVGVFRETLPLAARALGRFSVDDVAPRILAMLDDSTSRDVIVNEIRDRARLFTWERSGMKLRELVNSTLERPRNPVRTIVGEEGLLSI